MNYFFKYIITGLSFLAVLIASLSAYPQGIARIKEEGVLKVSLHKDDWPPFFMKDEKGELIGLDVDLSKGIAKSLGVELKFLRDAKTFDEIGDLVFERKANMAVAYLSNTLARAQYLRFSEPYVSLRQAALINRVEESKTEREGDVDGLLNHPDSLVAALEGSSYISLIAREYPKAKIKTYPEWELVLQDLKEGKILAALTDEIDVRKWAYQHPEQALAIRAHIFEDRPDDIAIALHPDDVHLCRWLNLYLSKMVKSGELEQLVNYYIIEEEWRTEK